jgi:hypothetical protein
MRDSGVRGVLVYCSDYKCSHYVTAGADPWPDQFRLFRSRAAFRLLGLRQSAAAVFRNWIPQTANDLAVAC